jgi:hypothetical protein
MSAIKEFARYVLEEATPRDLEAIEADLGLAQYHLSLALWQSDDPGRATASRDSIARS